MTSLPNKERHRLPETNEYQWRNLYLRQYGPCAYPPPMPRNPDALLTNKDGPLRRRNAVESDPSGEDPDAEGESLRGAERARWFKNRDSSLESLQHRLSEYESLELLTDEQLFSPGLFTFLTDNESPSGSLMVPCPPQGPRPSHSGSVQHIAMVLPSIFRANGGRSSLVMQRRQSDNDPEEDPNGSLAGAASLARLRRETWMLLMDNRIMSWFEREARSRGRVVASVQRHLLEVVTWTPTQRPRFQPLEGFEKQASPRAHEKDSNAKSAAAASEDERLMTMLERFAPFFAAISPPERLMCLAEHVAARQHGGSHTVAADSVGLPLLSQYATWREAYENRKAWRLAPYSFFLIYDCSYNHAHIAALYVLVDLVNRTSHTHMPDCLLGDRRQRGGVSGLDARGGRRSQRIKEPPQCPLHVMQQLTEDLLLAYEQSVARTTLPMALRVIDFLMDLLIDPDTAERFLSPSALRRQCSNAGAGEMPDDAPETEKKDENAATEKNSSSKTPREGSKPEARKEEGATAQSVTSLNVTIRQSSEMNDIDFTMMRQLNDTTFEELFVLVNWLVDAPTANSLIPINNDAMTEPVPTPPRPVQDLDSRVLSQGSLRSKKSNTWSSPNRRTTGGVSSVAESRRSQFNIQTSHASLAHEPSYIIGRAQEFNATTTIVEAITRYEIQRRALLDQHVVEMRSRASVVSKGKKQRRRRLAGTVSGPGMTDEHTKSSGIAMSMLPAGTTLLTAPLTFITAYIRLHGAPWLKELLGRLFNVLRRESVLLYVNAPDLEKTIPPLPAHRDSASQMSISGDQKNSPELPIFGGGFARWQHLTEAERQHHQRLERLEDLVCQDIQYVMEEFFSALHGKRSMTRLPQNISVLLTSLCTTIHLHLLSQHAALDMSFDKPAIRVRKCLDELRQKRVTGGVSDLWGIRQQDPKEKLLRSIEHHRLAKFILFDCWILPAMNNSIDFGFLSEFSSNHLRWNLDAFARYLKILVNASFIPSIGVDPYIYTTTLHNVTHNNLGPPSPMYPWPPRGPVNMSPAFDRRHRQQQQQQEPTPSQRCNTVKLPPFINGIYDVSSGNLVQIFRDPGNDEDESNQRSKFTFGDSLASDTQTIGRSSRSQQGGPGYDPSVSCSSFEHGRKTHSDLSGALSALNESLGITGGGDEGEAFEDDTDVTPARILNIFCARTASDISAKVVASEFEVAPATAACCIGKLFTLMSGEHEMVRQASLAGTLIGYFKSSPYLTCLMGVLHHPHTAATVLENTYQNNRKFYNALMKPLQDGALLTMMSSLLSQKNVPLVDSNELLSMIAAIPMNDVESVNSGEWRPLHISAWDLLTRRLVKRRTLATTGEALAPESVIFPLLRRCGPTNPHDLLKVTADAIQRDLDNVPLCFDTWWRAMVVALTTKAMNVLDECSDRHSTQWGQWCSAQIHEANQEYRGLCKYFTEVKGAKLDITKSKAINFLKENTSRRTSFSATGSVPRTLGSDLGVRKKKRKRAKIILKSEKPEKVKKDQ